MEALLKRVHHNSRALFYTLLVGSLAFYLTGCIAIEAVCKRVRPYRRSLSLVTLVAGLVLFLYAVSGFAYTRFSQARLEEEFANDPAPPPSIVSSVYLPGTVALALGEKKIPSPLASIEPPKVGSTVFRLEIPKIKLDNIVLYGSDLTTLKKGPGVVDDTSLPWLGGNTSLSAHRDTFFYRFGELAVGDEIRAITKYKAVFKYRITKISVVEPDDISVLDQTSTPTLTLITCWPLRFIGPAPQRMIVTAEIIKGEGA